MQTETGYPKYSISDRTGDHDSRGRVSLKTTRRTRRVMRDDMAVAVTMNVAQHTKGPRRQVG